MERFLILTLAAVCMRAQDTRIVAEPAIPPSCKILLAALQPPLAEADENKLDTARLQQALDQCPAAHAVALKADGPHNSFLTGPLQLRQGVTLLVDAGVTLLGSRNPRDYDVSPGSCGVVNQGGRGCKPLIAADRVAGAAVMGDGVIDGRGGAKLIGQNVSWWDLAQQAKAQNANQNCPRLMQLTRADNFTLYRITLKNAANFHVSYSAGNGFTAWGVIIDTPKTARNTDGIDPANSTNITIAHSYIHAGDDNIAIKAGSAGPSSHITIEHNHFYTGHGMSIGSETDGGVSAVRVADLSIDGADNGIRIKSNASRGGLVRDIVYSDVCIRDTKNPILMDSNYSSTGVSVGTRDKLPTFQGIVFHAVRVLSPGIITFDGYDSTHRLGITLDNVTLDVPATKLEAHHADIRLGPGPVNWDPSGDDVAIAKTAGSGERNACQNKFLPLPEK
jgi:polygalacturonase